MRSSLALPASVAAALLSSALLLGGCAAADHNTAEPAASVSVQVSPTLEASPSTPSPAGIVTYDPLPAGSGALLAGGYGVLVVDNGCVRFDSGMIPVFPSNQASWDGSTLAWAGETYSVGDTVTVGGGLASVTNRPSNIPAECGDGEAWIASLR